MYFVYKVSINIALCSKTLFDNTIFILDKFCEEIFFQWNFFYHRFSFRWVRRSLIDMKLTISTFWYTSSDLHFNFSFLFFNLKQTTMHCVDRRQFNLENELHIFQRTRIHHLHQKYVGGKFLIKYDVNSSARHILRPYTFLWISFMKKRNV